MFNVISNKSHFTLLQTNLINILNHSKIAFDHAQNILQNQQNGKNLLMFPDINELLCVTRSNNDGLVEALIGGYKVSLLIDSGAMVNAVSRETYEFLIRSKAFLFNTDFDPIIELRAFASVSPLKVSVRFQAKLQILFTNDTQDKPQCQVEEFYVIEGAMRCLLSRKTAMEHNVLALGQEVRRLRETRPCNNALDCYESGLCEMNLVEPGNFKSFDMEPVKLKIRRDVAPTKIRYTNIPFNMRDEARRQLKELEDQNIIEKITDYSKISWISSVIPVIKSNGKLRLVVDLRGPNKAIIREEFRMPTLDEVVSRLSGCKFFSTIDLANAFYHVRLHEESRYLTTFYSGEEYYQFNCLPFGLVNAPDIFQRALQDVVLKGCDSTLNYLDDILIYTATVDQHDLCYAQVMKRLEEHNVKRNLDKCKIKQTCVTFLGFNISGEGMAITHDKYEAFTNLREPASVSEVKSYLGMLTFLERFIVNRAKKTKHLRSIANSGQFIWSAEAQAEFDAIKATELSSIANLSFYNKEWKTELLVDASPTGLGAILVQFEPLKDYHDESEEKNSSDFVGSKSTKKNKLHIICCASRSLTVVEQRYPQQHREALAMVWGTERFRFYLIGSKFTIRTDNRANEFIFGSDAQIQGKRAVNRSQLFALKLQPYNFTVKRIPGNENAADALSRLIDSPELLNEDLCNEFEMLSVNGKTLPISIEEIEKACLNDELYKEIVEAIKTGIWSGSAAKFKSEIKKFTHWGNMLYYDTRFYVPEALRVKTLEIAHLGHVSATSMKRLLRSTSWWPGMTVDVNSFHAECRSCAMTSRTAITPPMVPRELPKRPMDELHVDFFEMSTVSKLLVAIDAYSRYLWVIEMSSTTASATNKALLTICDLWGKPRMIQSDCGPQFIGSEFKSFWETEGVTTRTTIPYASHTNGLVERQMSSIGHAIRIAFVEKKPWRKELSTYVRAYNTRPHSSTKFSPFQLLQGRKYHDYLPVFDSWDGNYELPPARSTIEANNTKAKLKQKMYYDKKFKTRESGITEGDWVLIKNTMSKGKSNPCYLTQRYRVMRVHNAMAIVRSENGKDYIRWIGHLKKEVDKKNLEVPNEQINSELLQQLLETELNIATETDEPNENPTSENSNIPSDLSEEEESVNVSKRFCLRNRKLIKIPARYMNCIFSIYD